MATKDSFIIYNDSLDILDELSNEQAGKLFKAIKAFHGHKDDELEAILEDKLIKLVFVPFTAQFKRDSAKYDAKCEKNRQIALKRWEKNNERKQANANACERMQSVTNYADSDSDSDSDSDVININNNNNNLNRERERDVNGKKVFDISTEIKQELAGKHQEWLETFCMNHHLTMFAVAEWLDKFIVQLQNDGEQFKTIADFKRHFSRWFNINNTKSSNATGQSTTKAAQRQRNREQRDAARLAKIAELNASYLQGGGSAQGQVSADNANGSLQSGLGTYPFD